MGQPQTPARRRCIEVTVTAMGQRLVARPPPVFLAASVPRRLPGGDGHMGQPQTPARRCIEVTVTAMGQRLVARPPPVFLAASIPSAPARG